jgi:invasion protein IalB
MFAGKKALALFITLATATAVMASVSTASAKSKPPAAAEQPAARQVPTRIQQFNAWGAYSYASGKSKVCYVLSVPAEKSPPKIDHGDNFFLVTQRPGQNISYEPQAMMGYELKQGSKVKVTVDTKAFTMFIKDRSAWLENAAEEPALVAAMKSGHQMKVDAVSKRGTATSYTYSLSGISAALKQIESCQ